MFAGAIHTGPQCVIINPAPTTQRMQTDIIELLPDHYSAVHGEKMVLALLNRPLGSSCMLPRTRQKIFR